MPPPHPTPRAFHHSIVHAPPPPGQVVMRTVQRLLQVDWVHGLAWVGWASWGLLATDTDRLAEKLPFAFTCTAGGDEDFAKAVAGASLTPGGMVSIKSSGGGSKHTTDGDAGADGGGSLYKKDGKKQKQKQQGGGSSSKKHKKH